MKQIIIDIDEQGNVSVEGKGFKGPECRQMTAAIEESLGTVENVTLKPEYRMTPTVRKVTA